MKSPTKILLNEVRQFLRRTRMPHTSLGIRALGDPNLVRNLQEGRELRHQTLMKVKKFMSSHEQSKSA